MALKPVEIDYLDATYVHKERQFITAQVTGLPNLGAKSTQRAEGLHSVLRKQLKRQTPLPKAISILTGDIKRLDKALQVRQPKETAATKEAEEMRKEAATPPQLVLIIAAVR
ncbi:MAG: hypothetical protein M1835_003301 [Candelina submexicana]|nr:MAG: hypothetical protein M1835_003301 [Candelina submexicana]